jgi:hypothetical protein
MPEDQGILKRKKKVWYVVHKVYLTYLTHNWVIRISPIFDDNSHGIFNSSNVEGLTKEPLNRFGMHQ